MIYLDKIKESFNGINYLMKDIIEFFTIDIDNIDNYKIILEFNKTELEFELDELDIRLRALRDKLENG